MIYPTPHFLPIFIILILAFMNSSCTACPNMPMESFKSFHEQMFGRFPHIVMYAVLEWIMIMLLFIDGLLAFASNEFAKLCGLRIPCLLCTRIDHVLVHRSSSFYYNDSICESHKKDISSLAYCHRHKKLSDIRTMCQACLVPFTSDKDPNTDKYKSIVGILHKDIDRLVEDERRALMKREDAEFSDEKSGNPWCSCCGEPVKLKSSMKYLRNISMKSPAPSPRISWLGNRIEDARSIETPRTRYAELKFIADTESEFPQDDALNGDNQGRDDLKVTTTPLIQEPEDMSEDAVRTPSFIRGNKYFGNQLDSVQDMSSPRWLNRGVRKPPPEQGEFPLDPNDISPLNEVDSDILNHLKKQVRLDHKSLMAMYLELDKERNAAAVAANNAMAMITKIQAEKAAVQMEALQYQRMMEEQAEYDDEAIQVMRDMLAKRDDDIKALESELEMYRDKYGPIIRVGSDICEVDADEDVPEIRSEKSDNESFSGADQNEHSMEEVSSSFDFDGERSYLLGLLSDLEKKIDTDAGSNGSELGAIKTEDESKGNENKAMLTREVSMIKERLRVVEADSGFLKHAAMTLQVGGEGTKLLNEIVQHLRALRQTGKSPSDVIDA
ncbi:hypothetical protein ACS0TY_006955 [Phlomoides rotata]